jgi:YrbI family 3-deoxy-D-manno-octulosonate 8-phosphate phosphatase
MKKLRPSDIALVAFDFDGVLTDNRVLVMQDGTEAVFCNRADGLGFDILRKNGIAAMILSTEKNPVVAARAAKLKVPVLHGVEEKGQALETYCSAAGIPLARVLFVGNDINDLPAIRRAGYSLCPFDAHPAVVAACDRRLKTRGGAGVVREVVEKILRLSTESDSAA